MQFGVVTKQSENGDLVVSSVPLSLLLYSNCKDADEFTKSIIDFRFDEKMELAYNKYCMTTGQLIFCHYKSNEVAVMSFVLERILTESSCIYNLHRIYEIEWKNNWSFLKTVQRKILSNELTYKLHVANQVKYYAIPIADLKIPEAYKNKLRFWKCILGINVAFKTDDGTITRRCNLFPSTLLSALNNHIKTDIGIAHTP